MMGRTQIRRKMKRFTLAAVTGLLLSLITSAPSSAGSYCNNGSYSSNSGRGTCSYNGGVNRNYPSYSDPGSSSWNRNNSLSNNNSYNYSTPSYSNKRSSKSNNGWDSWSW
jgi:hypothetical protein